MSSKCNNHGTWNAGRNACNCIPGWSGVNCDTNDTCGQSCVNGYCDAYGKCNCHTGWSGVNCNNNNKCTKSCVYGYCDAAGKCNCHACYSGVNCDTMFCNTPGTAAATKYGACLGDGSGGVSTSRNCASGYTANAVGGSGLHDGCICISKSNPDDKGCLFSSDYYCTFDASNNPHMETKYKAGGNMRG